MGKKGWSFKNFYKRPKTTQEKRWNEAHKKFVRGKRSPNHLPDSYWDIRRGDTYDHKNWKNYRSYQWKYKNNEGSRFIMDSCIILNADYTFLNTVSWQKAITLIVKGKTEVLKYTEKVVRNFERTVIMKIPAVMKLINIVRIIYRTHVPFNKRNVIVRDEFKCVYCGMKSKSLTVDHVIPISKGGKSNFENCVAACKKCNVKKGNKLPSEVNMYFQRKPFQPTIAEFLRLKLKKLGLDIVLKELGVY